MIRQLPAIRQRIEALADACRASPSDGQWTHFDDGMADIEHQLYVQFKENPDRVAVWDAQNFHADLVQLIDDHSTADPDQDMSPPLGRLLDMLRFCERMFQVPIDLHAPVPVVYRRQTCAQLDHMVPVIVRALAQKRVDPALIDKITHGLNTAAGQSAASMDYATHGYLSQFVPALARLAESTLRKDWNLRLFRFFIQYNYNHMGIYNWWARETERALRDKAPLDELEHIHRLSGHIEHIDQRTELGYERWRKPLKTQLLAFLNRRRTLLTDKMNLQEEMRKHVLVVDIPPDEHNIHFNQDYDAGVYGAYPSKEKASEAYVKVIRGPEGMELSAHSLRKADKTKYYGAADRVDEKLDEKKERLRQRFGLILTSRRAT